VSHGGTGEQAGQMRLGVRSPKAWLVTDGLREELPPWSKAGKLWGEEGCHIPPSSLLSVGAACTGRIADLGRRFLRSRPCLSPVSGREAR
jgi:hypothetical protein